MAGKPRGAGVGLLYRVLYTVSDNYVGNPLANEVAESIIQGGPNKQGQLSFLLVTIECICKI